MRIISSRCNSKMGSTVIPVSSSVSRTTVCSLIITALPTSIVWGGGSTSGAMQ